MPSMKKGAAVGINLCLVLAFALYAVVQLTRTTIAAQQIDDRVDSIVISTPEIAKSLTNVPKLDETGVTSGQILTAAKNLTGYLDRTITAAKGIDATAPKINQTVLGINTTVKSINQSTTSILGDVKSIVGSTTGIDDTTQRIRAGVAAINQRVDVVIGQAHGIDSDLTNVLNQVGGPAAGGFGNRNIAGHANSIDCTTLGSACSR
ncbi:MAG: hypothetical protein ABIV94_11765 [Acidimicrobiales bacterium]